MRTMCARPALYAAFSILLASSPACRRDPVGRVGMPGDRISLEINGRALATEVSSDEPSRRLGLMHRKTLPENSGMLFIYPEPERLSFWMKNTHVPLSIAFIDDRGAIVQIRDMEPLDEREVRTDHRVRYALEVNRGWFERNGIKVGDSFTDFETRVQGFRAS
jgi:uncharacterized membrane protein (UPF0127 family)